MNIQKPIILALLIGFSLPAAARMYQWVDPETGTTQLSGKPPVWYRSDEGGPRVFVFDNGRVVDDTGIEVSDIEKERLRQQALIRAERDRQKAREKLLDAKRIKALMDKDREAAEEIPEEVVDYEPEPEEREQAATESGQREQEQEQTAEAMRDLIREWERAQTQQAREVIGSERPAPPPDTDPPPPSDM